MAQSDKQECVGRFSYKIPPGWLVSGRSHEMYRAQLVDDLPAYVSEDQDRDRLMPLMRNGNSADSRPFIRQFAISDNALGMTFGYGDVNSVSLQLSVLAGTFESPLLLVMTVTSGKEDYIGKVLASEIANGYVPGARAGFCLTKGAMMLEPSRNESVSLTLTNPDIPDSIIRLSTRTTSKPRTDGPLTDIAGDIRAMSGTGTSLKSLGEKYRKVAGRKGHDGRTEMKEPNKEPVLIYSFFDGGVAGDQTSPEIIIDINGPAAYRDQLDLAWDEFLDSVEKVPLK